eukprot:12902648-Prorocentrum_lima.AAC.1
MASLGSTHKVFDVVFVGDEKSSVEHLAQVEKWTMEHDYVTMLVEFSDEIGDTILRSEILFLS